MSSLNSVIDRVAEYTEEDASNIDEGSRLTTDLQLSDIDVLQLVRDLESEFDIEVDEGLVEGLVEGFVTVKDLADAIDEAITESKRRVL